MALRVVPDGLRYERVRVRDLTPYQYTACYMCNMGYYGEMQGTLEWLHESRDPRAVAYMLWKGNYLVGWVLRFGVGYNIHTYIRESYRRRGYGSFLVRETKRGLRTVTVYPWDHRSNSFYGKMNQKTVLRGN